MPKHLTRPIELEHLVSYRLAVLANQLSLGISRIYGQRFGLVLREWRVIAVLAQYAPTSARNVIERSGMDKARVSRAVRSLTTRGLVRAAPDPSDSRARRLELTAAGRKLYAQVVPISLERQRRLLSALTATERVALDVLLAKLAQQVDRMNSGLADPGEDPDSLPGPIGRPK